MVGGNILTYGGGILMYTSTSPNLAFTGAFEIGCTVAGVGIAAVLNSCITYQFEMHKRWQIDLTGVGARASTVFGLLMSFSALLGGTIAPLTVPETAETATLTVTMVTCVVTTVLIIVTRIVK